MQDLPEYWAANNKEENFNFSIPDISTELRNEIVIFLKNGKYSFEEEVINALDNSNAEKFNDFLTVFLYILVKSGYDSKEKIITFLRTSDGIVFFNSLKKYPPILIHILINSGIDKVGHLNNFFNLKEKNISHEFLLGFSEISLKILANRGIDTLEKIDYFFKFPKGNDYRDPLKLPNMEFAVKRMLKAVENKEKILIFGDYDADGIISTVMLYGFLKKIGIEALYNIPDRTNDGYDINLKFITGLKKKHPEISLIICVDCGSNSNDVKKHFYRDHRELDIIVCDHHKISEKSSETLTEKNRFIVINPQDPISEYDFKFLSGAGVTFKFIQAIISKMENKNEIFEKSYLTDLLDLVAISTIADLMPLVDENRLLVKKGLSILKNTKNPGLETLIKHVLPDKIGTEKEISTYDVGYVIAPRLNAPGRINDLKKNTAEPNSDIDFMQTENEKSYDLSDAEKNFELNIAKKSFRLLTCTNDEADKLVSEINELNEERKRNQSEMLNSILGCKAFDFEKIAQTQKIFIEKSDKWSEGLLGIVASDLVRKYNIPVILFKEDNEKFKGSGRSIEDFDLFENLNKLSRFIDKFGGHKLACGLTIKAGFSSEADGKGKSIDNYNVFKKEMIKLAKKKLNQHKIEKKYFYDAEIDFSALNSSFLKELKLMEPFGIGNSKPIFLIRDCMIKKVNFLKNEKHAVLQIKNRGSYKKALFFNITAKIAQDLKKIQPNASVSLLCQIEENKYEKLINTEGSSLQLLLLDLFYKLDF
jgi:single-stranded-DNA-specific exonuclease